MIRLLLLRHATTDSVGERLSGRTPGEHLNEDGHMQAQALAKRIAHLPIARVYSRPLERAVETAVPLAEQLKQQVVVEEELVELNCGERTGCTFEALREQPAFQRFNTLRNTSQKPEKKSMLE